MKINFKIIICNIILLICTFFLMDYIIFLHCKHNGNDKNDFKYILKEDYVLTTQLYDYFDGKNNVSSGRLPCGLEYKEKQPILIFGCSYAHGQYLNLEQTISYKLSKRLKRPIYNRGILAGGLQHMYYQTTKDYFYKDVPYSPDIIYIFLNDHYYRMLPEFFGILDHHLYLHYNNKNDKFVINDYDNVYKNLFKSLYISRLINLKYVENYLNNPDNEEELTDLVIKYLNDSRSNLEKKWNKKSNFHVILYQHLKIQYCQTLKEKLKKNGYNVIDTEDLTNEKLNTEPYLMLDNYHPKEKAWDLLLEPIIKELNLE